MTRCENGARSTAGIERAAVLGVRGRVRGFRVRVRVRELAPARPPAHRHPKPEIENRPPRNVNPNPKTANADPKP